MCDTEKVIQTCSVFLQLWARVSLKKYELPIAVHILEVWECSFLSFGPVKIPVCAGVQMQTGLLHFPELFIEISMSMGVNHAELGP